MRDIWYKYESYFFLTCFVQSFIQKSYDDLDILSRTTVFLGDLVNRGVWENFRYLSANLNYSSWCLTVFINIVIVVIMFVSYSVDTWRQQQICPTKKPTLEYRTRQPSSKPYSKSALQVWCISGSYICSVEKKKVSDRSRKYVVAFADLRAVRKHNKTKLTTNTTPPHKKRPLPMSVHHQRMSDIILL